MPVRMDSLESHERVGVVTTSDWAERQNKLVQGIDE